MGHFISKPGTFLTLGVALLFAAIYLIGGRASQVFGVAALRRFHSFAAGIAVSYVFLYILPEFHDDPGGSPAIPERLHPKTLPGLQRLPVGPDRISGLLRPREPGGQTA